MTLWWSRRGSCGTDLRGYLGARESWSVLGRWKVVLRRTLRTLWELTWAVVSGGVGQIKVRGDSTPRRVAFAAALALAFGLLPALGPMEREH